MIRKRRLDRAWYPLTSDGCKAKIINYLSSFKDGVSLKKKVETRRRHGGLAPHAAWDYSGKLSCLTFYVLSGFNPDSIIILGGHKNNEKSTYYVEDGWETPLGIIPADTDLTSKLKDKLSLIPDRSNDGTIEVLTPFVKYFFPNSSLVAIRPTGSKSSIDVGTAIAGASMSSKKRILVIGSCDLIHYGIDYDYFPKGIGEHVPFLVEEKDRLFLNKITSMDFDASYRMGSDVSTCSIGSILSCMSYCKSMGSKRGLLLDYSNSYDVTMDYTSVVGYGSVVF